MGTTVIEVLRRFLPDFLRGRPALNRAQGRAIWAITHCRTAAMGGHLDACEQGCTREFHYHSCNHRSCPQCGRQHTEEWVERELGRRVGAPYFMVTFTLPEQLRGLFFSGAAKEIYDVLFAAAAAALSGTLADPRWLGAVTYGLIGDSRIIGMNNDQVSFRWKDRAKGGAPRVDTISGVEFVGR